MHDQSIGFIVTGRVQGVGYRWWTRRQARRLGLRGQVRNLADGSVEVHAHGPSDAVDEFARLLRKGPPGAAVDELRSVQPRDFEAGDFTIEVS